MKQALGPDRSTSRLYYRAREVASLTGLGLRTVYEGIYAGWIPSRKIGNARLIPAAWIHATTDAEAQQIATANSPNDRVGKIPKSRYFLGNPVLRKAANFIGRIRAIVRALHPMQSDSTPHLYAIIGV